MNASANGPSWDGAPPHRPNGHVPVMLAEVLSHLAPRDGEVIIDGTFGGGGYTRAILETGARVIAVDRDPAAVSRARALSTEFAALHVVEGTFGALDIHAADAGSPQVDGVVLDVGVSSFQLDQPERGFSFRHAAPLDMRMGGDGPTAADIINTASVNDLAHLLRTYGEERRAGALARAIVADRPFAATDQLAGLCERVVGRGREGIHPATRAFQALRIAVNDELGELARALLAAERVLKEGGRLVVVAFHSLEDRIVKRFLAARTKTDAGSRHAPAVDARAPSFVPLTKKALSPSEAEVAANPRARSAKLRAARRTAAAAHAAEPASLYPAVRVSGVLL